MKVMNINIPVKKHSNGECWLLFDNVLGRRVIFRAHKIDKEKKQVLDFDGHHVDQATARDSIMCRSKTYDISDKVLNL